MTHARRLATALTVVAATAASLLPLAAEAGPVTRQFEFSSTAGALQFGPQIGSFTYDDAVAPVGGGYVSALGLFANLDVSFGGFSFDETTANSGWLRFDPAGVLLDAHFGNNCNAGSCTISGGASQWWIRVGQVGNSVNDFSYSGFNGEAGFRSTNLNALLPNATVPEPASIALAALALVAAGATRRRQR